MKTPALKMRHVLNLKKSESPVEEALGNARGKKNMSHFMELFYE